MQENQGKELLRIENLVKNYGISNNEKEMREVEVLKGLSFCVKEGEFIGIMGRSGCGKTTLLKILGFLEQATKGEVFYRGENAKHLWGDRLAELRRNELGFVFQDFYLLDSLNIMENIMLPMILNEEESEKMEKAAYQYANQFGISNLLQKNPNELSGGEKQRTALCRALINNPSLVLADEPTGNLDSISSKTVIDALQMIHEEYGKTVVMVTHDPIIASYCEKVLFLKDGEILRTIHRDGNKDLFYQQIIERMKEL